MSYGEPGPPFRPILIFNGTVLFSHQPGAEECWGSGVFTALIGVLRRLPVLSSGEDGGSGSSSSSSSVWLLLMLPSCFSPSQVYLAASESSTRQSNLAFGCGLCRGFWQPGPHELCCCRHSSAPFSAEGEPDQIDDLACKLRLEPGERTCQTGGPEAHLPVQIMHVCPKRPPRRHTQQINLNKW